MVHSPLSFQIKPCACEIRKAYLQSVYTFTVFHVTITVPSSMQSVQLSEQRFPVVRTWCLLTLQESQLHMQPFCFLCLYNCFHLHIESSLPLSEYGPVNKSLLRRGKPYLPQHILMASRKMDFQGFQKFPLQFI